MFHLISFALHRLSGDATAPQAELWSSLNNEFVLLFGLMDGLTRTITSVSSNQKGIIIDWNSQNHKSGNNERFETASEGLFSQHFLISCLSEIIHRKLSASMSRTAVLRSGQGTHTTAAGYWLRNALHSWNQLWLRSRTTSSLITREWGSALRSLFNCLCSTQRESICSYWLLRQMYVLWVYMVNKSSRTIIGLILSQTFVSIDNTNFIIHTTPINHTLQY